MFDSLKLKREIKDLEETLNDLEEDLKFETEQKLKKVREYEIKINELNHKHKMALEDKDQELKHFKDNELAEMRIKLIKAEQSKAVLEQKVEMLDKIVDLDSDILDVKDVVSKLIEKLPTIKLDGIAATASSKNSK